MEIIYSAQRTNFVKGRTYLNPRFFQEGAENKKATHVIIVGDWPRVKACYEELDIKVTVLPVGTKMPSIEAGPIDDLSEKPPKKSSLPPAPEIPEELDGMSYRDLRNLCLEIDPAADISSKKGAIEFLEQHR